MICKGYGILSECLILILKVYEKGGSSDLNRSLFHGSVHDSCRLQLVWKVLHVRNTGMQLELSVKAGWNSKRADLDGCVPFAYCYF